MSSRGGGAGMLLMLLKEPEAEADEGEEGLYTIAVGDGVECAAVKLDIACLRGWDDVEMEAGG